MNTDSPKITPDDALAVYDLAVEKLMTAEDSLLKVLTDDPRAALTSPLLLMHITRLYEKDKMAMFAREFVKSLSSAFSSQLGNLFGKLDMGPSYSDFQVNLTINVSTPELLTDFRARADELGDFLTRVSHALESRANYSLFIEVANGSTEYGNVLPEATQQDTFHITERDEPGATRQAYSPDWYKRKHYSDLASAFKEVFEDPRG